MFSVPLDVKANHADVRRPGLWTALANRSEPVNTPADTSPILRGLGPSIILPDSCGGDHAYKVAITPCDAVWVVVGVIDPARVSVTFAPASTFTPVVTSSTCVVRFHEVAVAEEAVDAMVNVAVGVADVKDHPLASLT
jgi:hypothetical protein